MRGIKKYSVVTVALAATLGLAACGGGETTEDPTTSSSSSEASPSETETPEPVAEIASLSGDNTQVTLDAGFVEALTTLGVTPGPVGTATIADGVASFPITGGNVTYYEPGSVDPYVQGEINHDGSGLSLAAGETVVELTNFDIDPGAPAILYGDVAVNGEVAVEDAPLFDLDGSTLKPLQTTPEGAAVLEGTTVELSSAAADLLNETFGITDLAEGLVIGIAKLTVQ